LHDTASRNGTFVNGKRIVEPTRLQRGDEIKIYKRRLLFISESDCGSDEQMDNHPETAVLD
jgi:pSer/pThr/pTyr-binding forkhead associated (FHA) protein